MREACRIRSAKSDCLLMKHVEVESNRIGILNLECAVRPPGNDMAAIPDVAVANAINPLLRMYAKIDLYKKVFPVPPVSVYKKNCMCMTIDAMDDTIKCILLLTV
ncbi:hypothetical protein Syun_001806 [Stephania yunnanensis]|uniref:Uncharacterized protein n=1 Tax=Stephania yunnanensis TaxID=152371 RepID=A0AAP0LET1_9MAGN